MKAYSDKNPKNQSKPEAKAMSQKKAGAGSAFQFIDNRPEIIAQRKLKVGVENSPSHVKQLRAYQEMADHFTTQQSGKDKTASPSMGPVQRIIKIHGGGDEFENIVVRFCTFAKAHGGEAWEMLNWFWHGKYNCLDIASVVELDAQGYTDCQIGGKHAHALSNDEWAALKVNTPAKVIVSIKKGADPLNENDAKQYYVILHELMVHVYPFYQKMKSVREGVGPKSKAEAGYHEGPDSMGAHAEHQHLLNKNNSAFYELYNFMYTKMVYGLGHEIEEAFKGISPGLFSDHHEEDLMVQYIEEATLKSKNAHARVLKLTQYMAQMGSQELTNQDKTKRYQIIKTQFQEIQTTVREVWTEYHKAYTVHAPDYKPPAEEHKHVVHEELGELPYFNPNTWFPKTLAKLAKRIEDIKQMDQTLTGYNTQLTAAIAALSK